MAEVTDLQFLTDSFRARILLTLILFTVAISLFYTSLVSTLIYEVEDRVLKQHLENEIVRFLIQAEHTGKHTPLPSTSYLQGFWQDNPALPETIKDFPLGYHEVMDKLYHEEHVLVREVPGPNEMVYFVLQESKFSSIYEYQEGVYSLLLLIAGIVVMASVLVALVIARMWAKPVTDLAQDVSEGLNMGGVYSGYQRRDEIGVLSRAFADLVQQLKKLLVNEKSFTRYASHQMRTPLAVIRNSLSVLRLPSISEEKRQRSLQRIECACDEAERIVELFLWLGREEEVALEPVFIAPLLQEALANFKPLIAGQSIDIRLQGDPNVQVLALPSLVSVVLDNLLRNGISYGRDYLQVEFSTSNLCMTNPVWEEAKDVDQYGHGLEIVRRVCQRLDWQLQVSESEGVFQVCIGFAEHKG